MEGSALVREHQRPALAPRADVLLLLLAWAIGLSGLGMGMQSAAVRHLDVPGVATTYITGTLTTLVAGTVDRFAPRPREIDHPSR